jgi:1,4-alpha-glucan branching enzyme
MAQRKAPKKDRPPEESGAAETVPAATGDTTPFISDYDLHLLAKGDHFDAYRKLGAHLAAKNGQAGTYFAVWAPNAHYVAVNGDWNGWNAGKNPMKMIGSSGFWECFVPGVGQGALYKFFIESKYHGHKAEKADPYAFATELRPR